MCDICSVGVIFVLRDPPPPKLYTLSLHDALPICDPAAAGLRVACHLDGAKEREGANSRSGHGSIPTGCVLRSHRRLQSRDRKSTRLNSSHRCSSYAVFCLKKKKLRSKPPRTWIKG